VANQPFESYGTFPLGHLTRSDYGSNKETENDNATKALRRRKKKQEKEQQLQKKSEDIENYKGDKSLEEVLSFIGGGQNDSNKKAKKNSNVVEEIPSKTQKSNKKNKDKKQKSPVASSSVEEVEEKGSDFAQPALAGVETQGGEDNMGNSSGKADVDIVENGDVDSLYSSSEKVAKSSLKQNDKIDMSKHAIYVNNDKLAKGAICRESVKEKEPSATNNKRDIVTGSGVENNKKKSDKPAKASKMDKSELPGTKSDHDMLKLDASLINNVTVKQKNAKNKKNKSLSPPIKAESELSFADMNHQPVLASFEASENLVDDAFIFTDLEVPQVPKEDEFQVVGKKKKKVTKEVVPQNHFMTNNGNSKPGRRHEDKRPVLSQSSNKASVPSIVPPSSMVEGDARLRDLSPSAFPALTSGKGRQSVQEGRRNSTGDVPIPSGLKSQDDSDLESVKSLPATQGSQAVDSILSPRLSYAKMAAGPKVPDSCSSSEKRLSLDSGDCEHDHKKSVWKGSPTERRHSIGSSPEILNKVTGVQSSVATSTVKTGSQEHIVSDVIVNLEKGAASVANTAVTEKEETNSDMKNVKEPSVQNKEITSLSEANRTVKTSPVQMKSSIISPNKSTDSSTVHASSVGNSQVTLTSKQSQFCNNESETNSTYSVYNNKDNSVTNSNVISKGKTCSNNGSNGRKQKSVIFLDKRVEETPENLGISFGFEIDNLVKPGNSGPHDSPVIDQSEQVMQKSECHSACENVQFVDLNFYSNDLKSEPKDASDVVISGTSSNSSVISKYVSNTDKAINSLSSSNNEIVNPVTKLVRINGIIPPQGHSSNLVKEVTENVSVNIGGSGEKVDTEQAIPETTEDKNVEYVYYGESVVSLKKDIVVPSLNNGPTRYCGLVHYIQETDLRSNFNVAEAAAFLTRGEFCI
jgi:hypothetical protein